MAENLQQFIDTLKEQLRKARVENARLREQLAKAREEIERLNQQKEAS